MLITRYVMHRACATFCDFSPLSLLLSVPNYRFLIPILKCSNTLNNTGVWSLIELASLYTVTLCAVNGLSRLTTTSNGQTRPIRNFSNRPITIESNRIVTADSNSNRISKLRRSLEYRLYRGWQWRNNRSISVPIDFCRHLVGKTVMNVCRCVA